MNPPTHITDIRTSDLKDWIVTLPVESPETPKAYVDDNPKTVFGSAKPGLSSIPPSALIQLGQAMSNGRDKYGLLNWRAKRVSSSIYYDAAFRHILKWYDGEEIDPESGVLHLAHAMACCAILLDAQAIGNLNDDRPIPGTVSKLITDLTKPL